jgi:hypothetical protein
MPETASRVAQPGISRRLYVEEEGWPAGDPSDVADFAAADISISPAAGRRGSARSQAFTLRDCVSDHARADRMKDRGIGTGNYDRVTRIADYHVSPVERYSQAARYPRVPASPDPLEPKYDHGAGFFSHATLMGWTRTPRRSRNRREIQ